MLTVRGADDCRAVIVGYVDDRVIRPYERQYVQRRVRIRNFEAIEVSLLVAPLYWVVLPMLFRVWFVKVKTRSILPALRRDALHATRTPTKRRCGRPIENRRPPTCRSASKKWGL